MAATTTATTTINTTTFASDTSTTSIASAIRSLESLPYEILALIISHTYAPWSLSVLDRVVRGTLAIDGLPSNPLFLVSRTCASLALTAERTAFTGELIFTTSCTQWRVLTRLRALEPTRFGALLDEIHTLRFCSPPLFTNRIPWPALPGLRRVELDYCKRSATFRAQGTLGELEAGYLDVLVVGFARDSERFDGPVVEDAWRVGKREGGLVVGGKEIVVQDGLDEAVRSGGGDAIEDDEGISVVVTKTMNVTESPNYCPGITPIPTPLPFGGSCSQITENWKIRVTALHRGQLESVSYRLIAGFHEVPLDMERKENVVWTSKAGFRATVPPEKLDGVRRKLVPSELGLKFCF